VKQCLRWLESVPFLGTWAKIEGVFPSYSTLIILSIPVPLWDLLPDNPAYTFIGYITGPGVGPELSTRKCKVPRAMPVCTDLLPDREQDLIHFRQNDKATHILKLAPPIDEDDDGSQETFESTESYDSGFMGSEPTVLECVEEWTTKGSQNS
jgi:hypothetical protein